MISYIGVKIEHKIGGQKTYWLILVSCLIFTFHCSNTAVMYCSIIYVRFKLFFLLFILFVLFVWEKPRGVVCTLRLTERIQLQIITQQTLVFQNIKFKVEFPVSKMATLSLSLSLIVTFVLILHSWKPILILLNFPISEVAKSSSSVVSVWTHSTLMNTPIVHSSVTFWKQPDELQPGSVWWSCLGALRLTNTSPTSSLHCAPASSSPSSSHQHCCHQKLLGGAQAHQYIIACAFPFLSSFFYHLRSPPSHQHYCHLAKLLVIVCHRGKNLHLEEISRYCIHPLHERLTLIQKRVDLCQCVLQRI